jgi:hypothetical protein
MAKVQIWNITCGPHSIYEYERGEIVTTEELIRKIGDDGRKHINATSTESPFNITDSLYPKGDEIEFPEVIYALTGYDEDHAMDYMGLTYLDP